MWAEGAMGYQFMALQALIIDAEVLWHHGIDMYRYRDCALKRLFDSPLQFCYPDLTTPAMHDSGRDSIVGGDSYLYEYAYRRYRDPGYLLILNQTGRAPRRPVPEVPRLGPLRPRPEGEEPRRWSGRA